MRARSRGAAALPIVLRMNCRQDAGDPTQIVPGFAPDLDKNENRLTFASMVRF